LERTKRGIFVLSSATTSPISESENRGGGGISSVKFQNFKRTPQKLSAPGGQKLTPQPSFKK